MIPFTGTVWRMTFEGQDARVPVTSPEGRFHHSGQVAIYSSLTAEGTAIAIRRYMSPEDAPRQIQPLQIDAARVADLRGNRDASVIWQDIRATGAPSPTWAFSDAARANGAQAMLYSSRSRPDLSHLVIFDPQIARAHPDAAAQPWPKDTCNSTRL
ncbi:RES family NAD+ phosphorylase [Ruegeria sp. 2205SS24-7]|uniref:RES family NAD+ phosphorylase n=1 Tax=Ruegeria discodermiae TaxID=3064389 RepID=UPI0027413E2D|nr:RES family NAD+ phosphorylase [Ruegeria sp. 2205SS24-7]MDP5219231.1 RES family NAD+ phosphorylase [Ruegeria sp. 2205SS24-7]